jgi:hypothetical protein
MSINTDDCKTNQSGIEKRWNFFQSFNPPWGGGQFTILFIKNKEPDIFSRSGLTFVAEISLLV